MTSYQHKKCHCGYKTISGESYLQNGISITCKTTSLYKIGTQASLFDDYTFIATWLYHRMQIRDITKSIYHHDRIVSNNRQLYCLFNRLSGLTTTKTSKLGIIVRSLEQSAEDRGVPPHKGAVMRKSLLCQNVLWLDSKYNFGHLVIPSG